jgi:hypothetical protein
MNQYMQMFSENNVAKANYAVLGSVYVGGPPYLADWNPGVIKSTKWGSLGATAVSLAAYSPSFYSILFTLFITVYTALVLGRFALLWLCLQYHSPLHDPCLV